MTFNVSATDETMVDTCVYSLDGMTNRTMTNDTIYWSASNSSLTNGSHSVYFYCNDTSGYTSSASSSFSADIYGNGSCTSWYNKYWRYKKNIVIDSAQVDADLYNFPLAINITDADLAAYAQNDADDIVFTTDNGCDKLDHEIEFFNSTTGYLVAWVRIPFISSSTNTTIMMYYNNSAVGPQQNPEDVWDANYTMIQHLDENPTSDGTHHTLDNDARTYGSIGTTDWQFGPLGRGYYFNDDNDYMWVNNSAGINPDDTLTVEFWIKDGGGPGWRDVILKSAFTTYGWRVLNRNDYQMSSYNYGGSGESEWITNNATAFDGKWHHVVYAFDTGTVRVFVDGAQAQDSKSYTHGSGFSGASNLLVAATGSCSSCGNFTGTIDEIRFSNISRSNAWITAEYRSQNSTLDFYFVEGQEEADSCSYMGSGAWNISASDNCTISSPTDVGGNDIYITGYGYITITADITNYGKLHIEGPDENHKCRVICTGGCFS